jgi:GxxExxY protein
LGKTNRLDDKKGMPMLLYEELTSKILGACFDVSNELGCGFLESVYLNSVLIALADMGVMAESQVPLKVNFRNQNVGEFYADIVVEGIILLELKAVKMLIPDHLAQVMNYLKATDLKVGLLLNFGNPKLEYRRFG